jgi:hypothetical protein
MLDRLPTQWRKRARREFRVESKGSSCTDERNKSFSSHSTAIGILDEKVSWAFALPWLSYGEDWLNGGIVKYFLEDQMRRPSADEACEMGTCIKSFD